MRFQQAVAAVPSLRDGYRPGLQAVKAEYRDRFDCTDTRRLAGSIDLDSTLERSLPNEPRWDYGVGFSRVASTDAVYWVEVHPATASEVTSVLSKLAWLRDWLRHNAPRLLEMTAAENGYVWIASKDIGFRPGSRQAKRLEAHGMRFPCRRLRLD